MKFKLRPRVIAVTLFLLLVVLFEIYNLRLLSAKDFQRQLVKEIKQDIDDSRSTLTSPDRTNHSNESTQSTSIKEIYKVTHVIDGDTIELEDGSKIRYIGIDAPEAGTNSQSEECFAKEATAKNKELVEGKQIIVQRDISNKDRYGRLLRYVWVGDIFVNTYLVNEGFAYAKSYPPDVTLQDSLIAAQTFATDSKKGVWSSVCRR